MELRQLATFIRVAQFKSFSRAAESLGYSQSAVTVQIRQLEEELDTRLFDRMGKRVILRMPFIPGVNTDEETLHAVGKIAERNRIEELHILPFHQVGSNKWHALRREYDCESWRLPTEEETQNAQTILRTYIPYVSVGGQEYHEEG